VTLYLKIFNALRLKKIVKIFFAFHSFKKRAILEKKGGGRELKCLSYTLGDLLNFIKLNGGTEN